MNQLANTLQHQLPPVYNREQAILLFQQAGSSEATLYRQVRNHEIRTYLPAGKKRGVVFDKHDVDAAVAILSPTLSPSSVLSRLPSPLAMGWARKEQIPYLYLFDVKMRGMEAALDPKVFSEWITKNPYLCWALFQQNDPTQIFGVFTILPLPEEVIFRLLQRKLSERELSADQIQVYRSGRTYIGYIRSLLLDPQAKQGLASFSLRLFQDWCQFFPRSQFKKLYSSAPTADADKLLARFYFAPRYDLGRPGTLVDRAASYELDLRRPNHSHVVQKVQQLMHTLSRPDPLQALSEEVIASVQLYLPEDHDPDSPIFEKATFADIAETVAIDSELYSHLTKSAELRQQRYRKNPDAFYVLWHRGQIVAHTYFFPIEPHAHQELMNETGGTLPLDAFLQWEVGKPLEVHIAMVSVRKGSDPGRRYGMRLIAGIIRVFEELGRQGVIITKVTARSETQDGVRLCQSLGMVMEAVLGFEGRYRFFFDMRSSPMKLARLYQAAYAEYQIKQMQRLESTEV